MADTNTPQTTKRFMTRMIVPVVIVVAITAVGVTALLVNIMERKREAQNPLFRVVEVTEDTVDPAIWGKNFPLQYDAYRKTVDQKRTRFGGRKPCQGRRQTPTRAPSFHSRGSKRTPGSRRCGRATRSPKISAKSGARLHARRPDIHREAEGREAARHLSELPRVDGGGLQKGGRRRRRKGVREDKRDAVCRGAGASRPPRSLYRLPRPRDHVAPRDAARVHGRDARFEGVSGGRRTTT